MSEPPECILCDANRPAREGADPVARHERLHIRLAPRSLERLRALQARAAESSKKQ